MSPRGSKSLAAIKLHPELIVGGSLVAASAGRNLWPLRLPWALLSALQALGMGLAAAGLLALALAYGAMARARTTINPRRHTRTIVSTGIYRLSRNPIYVGWFVLLLGVGLASASLWTIAVSLAMIAVLRWAVVLEEEKYLENAFGEDYLRYKRSVRRWL